MLSIKSIGEWQIIDIDQPTKMNLDGRLTMPSRQPNEKYCILTLKREFSNIGNTNRR